MDCLSWRLVVSRVTTVSSSTVIVVVEIVKNKDRRRHITKFFIQGGILFVVVVDFYSEDVSFSLSQSEQCEYSFKFRLLCPVLFQFLFS